MNCLNILLSEDGTTAEAVAGAKKRTHDTTGVGMGVPLPLVRATPASSSLPARRGF